MKNSIARWSKRSRKPAKLWQNIFRKDRQVVATNCRTRSSRVNALERQPSLFALHFRLGEQLAHFVIARLRKILVELSHAGEGRRSKCADDVIYLTAKFVARLG